MEIDKINDFGNKRILVVGDVMVDRYISGSINRISPEAPVPIVEVENEVLQLGGAANVMNNIIALGAKVSAIGVVGEDENGNWLRRKLKNLGILTENIVIDDNRPTTTKTRIVVGHNHVVRFDKELTNEIENKITKKIIPNLNELLHSVDGVIVSDYDKGLLTSKLIKAIIQSAKKHGRSILVDPKLRHHMDYKNVDIIKTNIHNAFSATGVSHSLSNAERKVCASILKKLHCKSVVITKGKDGMAIMQKDNSFITLPSLAKEVFDVTGAGDVVAAVLGLSYFSGFSVDESAIISTLAAGVKVSKLGTYVVTRNDIFHAVDLYDGDLNCIRTIH